MEDIKQVGYGGHQAGLNMEDIKQVGYYYYYYCLFRNYHDTPIKRLTFTTILVSGVDRSVLPHLDL